MFGAERLTANFGGQPQTLEGEEGEGEGGLGGGGGYPLSSCGGRPFSYITAPPPPRAHKVRAAAVCGNGLFYEVIYLADKQFFSSTR